MALISAVLGTDREQSRDANTLALLNYGFGDFSVWTPVRADQVVAFTERPRSPRAARPGRGVPRVHQRAGAP